MRFRFQPPLQVMYRGLVTLGIYDLVWLLDVQKQLAQAGIAVARPAPIIFIRLLYAICAPISIIVIGVVLFVPSVFSPPAPSPDCWSAWAINASPGEGHLHVPYTDECKAEIYNYNRYDALSGWLMNGIIFDVIFGVVLTPIYWLLAKNWINTFSLGIQQATGNQVSGYMVAFLLVYFSIGFGTALLQSRLNAASGGTSVSFEAQLP